MAIKIRRGNKTEHKVKREEIGRDKERRKINTDNGGIGKERKQNNADAYDDDMYEIR